MANPEHVKIVRKGKKAIAAWREMKSGTHLDLSSADLRHVDLSLAQLWDADLSGAKLNRAELSEADLTGANLSGADLRGAYLRRSEMTGTNLSDAKLSGAALHDTHLCGAILYATEMAGVVVGGTRFDDVSLADASGLESVSHNGPCTIGVDTLMKSQGKIPDVFLRGCGLQPWEVVAARIYDPDLTALEIADIQAESFRLRTEGPIFIGGVFISYAREDSEFVDKVYGRLHDEGASAWLDKHDVVAGPIDRQIIDAIRLNDIMLVVLSKNSVDRRWVQHEIRTACEREEKENRTILCPIALDDSWKAKEGVDWSQLRQKAVLDFSVPDGFDTEFKKLLDGMKKYYPTKGSDGATGRNSDVARAGLRA